MAGMFVGKRVAVRPDIVIAKGHFKGIKDFVNSRKAIDVLIECKEDPFDKWKDEIESADPIKTRAPSFTIEQTNMLIETYNSIIQDIQSYFAKKRLVYIQFFSY